MVAGTLLEEGAAGRIGGLALGQRAGDGAEGKSCEDENVRLHGYLKYNVRLVMKGLKSAEQCKENENCVVEWTLYKSKVTFKEAALLGYIFYRPFQQ